MKTLTCLVFLLACLFAVGISTKPVKADGIIIPPPCEPDRCMPTPVCTPEYCPPPPRPIAQLTIRYHHVDVTIVDQLAITRVDQVFTNPNDWAIEGTYVFPLPPGAVATGLKLWVDGEPVEGKLLDAEEARRIYEETVRFLRDPALLEYTGRGALQLSLFPIPPGGERRIQVEYNQVLQADNGLIGYTYPLNTEKFSIEPLEDVSIRVELSDKSGLRAVYSPTHSVDVTREGSQRALVSYFAKNILPDTDFSLYFSTGTGTNLHILTYRDPGDLQDKDGYFLLLLAPDAAEGKQPLPKDVLLVLDRSGSMEGEKFRQAQEALRFVLTQLQPDDRFYLQAYSTGIQTYATDLRSVDEVPEALAWAEKLGASGSTDINRALLEAAAAVNEVHDPLRPIYLIFLTDGLPTTGEVQTQNILDNFMRAAPENLHLFAFGVGYDVDTTLLDTLSGEHNGTSTYVRPEEPLDEKLSSFYETISRPVMTDLALDFGGLSIYDLNPNPMPDLFAGNQIMVAGRYREGGVFDLAVRGKVGPERLELSYPGMTFAQDSRTEDAVMGSIARIWAARKVGGLLNQVRLIGPDEETIAQIVRLSVRFGIITPYTSYLVEEPMLLGVDAQNKIAKDAYSLAQAEPTELTGQGAVERALQESELQDSGAVPQSGRAESDRNAVRTVGGRTFVYTQDAWTDTSFDPKTMVPVEVPFLSEEYFALAQSRSDLAAVLALGERVIVVSDGKVYRVIAGHAGTSVQVTKVSQEDPFVRNTDPAATPVLEQDQLVETPTPLPNAVPGKSGGCPPILMFIGLALLVSLLKKKGVEN